MKTGKFPGMDDITSELMSSGVEGTVKTQPRSVSEYLGTEEVANGVDQITGDSPTKPE